MPMRILLVPLLLSALATAACYFTAGPSLNFLIGPLLFAPLLVPPLTNLSPRLVPIATAAPSAILWLILQRNISFSGWLSASLVLLTFSTMLSAGTYLFTRLLNKLRMPETIASAIITLLAYTWLAAPICFPRAMVTVIPAHPIFAINTANSALGIWTEQRIIYQLTTLGQDIPYELPSSAIPCLFIQTLLTAICFALAAVNRKSPQGTSAQT